MADGVLQYIGARYVPKFYLNSDGTPEWKPGVAFEPLTIVTWNNNSYTSRKPVPAEIGEPSLNPEYWAQTGVYNAQIGQLQTDVAALQTSMDDAESEIESLNNKVHWFTPEMYGAAGDNTTDDTSAIQNMINAMSPGDCAVFSAGSYYCAGRITIPTHDLHFSGLFGRSEFTPFLRTDLSTGTFITVKGYGCTFQHVGFRGHGFSTPEAETLIEFDMDNADANGNIDATMRDILFFETHCGVKTRGRNLEITDSGFSTCAFGARYMQTEIDTDCRGMVLMNNRFHLCGTCVTNDITNLREVKNIVITNNFGDMSNTFFAGYGGGLFINGNYFDKRGFNGTSSCIVINPPANQSTDDIYDVISNNKFVSNGNGNAIMFSTSGKCIVKGNVIQNFPLNGIGASAGTIICIGNVLNKCGTTTGTYPVGLGGAVTGIVANNVVMNSERGIAAGGCTVENNYTLS